jgi:hypothetical protein
MILCGKSGDGIGLKPSIFKPFAGTKKPAPRDWSGLLNFRMSKED